MTAKKANIINSAFGILFLTLTAYNSISGRGYANFEFVGCALAFIVLIFLSLRIKGHSKFIPLGILLLTIVLFFEFPFEFLYGWADYKLNKKAMEKYVSAVQSGKYNAQLKNDSGWQQGALLKTNTLTVKAYKDDSMQIVFFKQGWYNEIPEYFGVFYVSNESIIKMPLLTRFFNNDYKITRLDKNWYWVHTYTDLTPGP